MDWREAGITLTGHRRHRVGFRKRLVLQVEEKYYLSQWKDHGPLGRDWKYRWRDATINDVSEGLV